MTTCPTLLISAPASGAGKTTITAALARHYSRRGYKVQVFKTGPDFLDPMILEQASGRPVYQLDLWMGSESHCRELLFEAAHMAPSVGMMQPWRFIRITDLKLREQLHALVEAERLATAKALQEREDEFMKLKVEGILDCGELVVAALMNNRESHVFGRRTLPEMDLASVACAIQNMWLAARAEGLGMGWVSMFDPTALSQLLSIPRGAKPVAILCIGHVENFYNKPMLELEGWTCSRSLSELITTNNWNTSDLTDGEMPR